MGTRNNRLVHTRVLEPAQPRMIDAVLVAELPRWRRLKQDLLDMFCRLAGWNVSPVAMNGMTCPFDTRQGRMTAEMAQFERDLLSKRMKSGLVTARAVRPKTRVPTGAMAPIGTKVLHAAGDGRSCYWIGNDSGFPRNPAADIVKRHRDEWFAMLFRTPPGSTR